MSTPLYRYRPARGRDRQRQRSPDTRAIMVWLRPAAGVQLDKRGYRTRTTSRRSTRFTGRNAVLEYPQSGERIRGRRNIQASRSAQPSKKRFTVRRITGATDLWITELVIGYDS
jgi:hypothetical protein